MGILSAVFGGGRRTQQRVEPAIRNVSPENPSTSLTNPDAWFAEWASGGATASFGPLVSEQTAMRASAVFACVNLWVGVLSSVPLKIYKDDPETGERTEAPQHRLSRLLSLAPLPGGNMTAATWRGLWACNIMLWGNQYSIIRYDGAGRVVGFHYVPPWKVEVHRLAGVSWYRCMMEDGSFEVIHQGDMLHMVGPGFDGIKGLSRIQSFARNTVGLAVVLEEQTGRVHENAARPSGVISTPANLDKDSKRRMEAYFNANSAGRENAGKVLFLDKDQEFKPLQMSPEDLNTLEMRRYTNVDIARFFGTPPHLIGETANVSAWGSGIEQNTLGWKTFHVEPQYHCIEQELRLKLFSSGPYYAAFDREKLINMDAKTAAEIRQIEIQSGQLTPNEARRKLNRPRLDDGDQAFINSASITLANAANPPDPAAPAPPKGK
jgi:HK97 family phage portal protein